MKKDIVTIKEAYAVYTGGGIWIFYGSLTCNYYFLTDDYSATLILKEDPADFEVSLYEDWQKEHLVVELMGTERVNFCNNLVDALRKADEEHRGGISDEELEKYREWFALEY